MGRPPIFGKSNSSSCVKYIHHFLRYVPNISSFAQNFSEICIQGLENFSESIIYIDYTCTCQEKVEKKRDKGNGDQQTADANSDQILLCVVQKRLH